MVDAKAIVVDNKVDKDVELSIEWELLDGFVSIAGVNEVKQVADGELAKG